MEFIQNCLNPKITDFCIPHIITSRFTVNFYSIKPDVFSFRSKVMVNHIFKEIKKLIFNILIFRDLHLGIIHNNYDSIRG